MRRLNLLAITFLLSAFFLLSCSQSQNSSTEEAGTSGTDSAGSGAPKTLYSIRENNMWGYIDQAGKVIVKPQYSFHFNFSEGLARVVTGVQASNMGEPIVGKYGYIDTAGKTVIPPQFDYAGDFHEGLAVVVMDSKAGAIDKTGKIVIALQFEILFNQYPLKDFHEGLAAFYTKDARGFGVWGFIDRAGQIVVRPQFAHVGFFSEGLAWVETDISGYFNVGFIDKEGKMVIKPQFAAVGYTDDKTASNFSAGLAAVQFSRGMGHHGFVDKSGRVVIDLPDSSEVNEFSEELASVCKTYGSCEYIDKTGKSFTRGQYARAASFSEGLANVQNPSGKWQYIDKTGNVFINGEFDKAEPFKDGLAYVTVGNKSGYIDKTGKFVWSSTV